MRLAIFGYSQVLGSSAGVFLTIAAMTTAGEPPFTRTMSLPSAGRGRISPGAGVMTFPSERTSTVSPAAARGRDLAYSAMACITWPRQRVVPPGALACEVTSQLVIARASGAAGLSLAAHQRAL